MLISLKNFFKKRSFYSVALSVIFSVAFVAFAASAATTISTNISTGGTLTVSGNSTLGNSASDVNLSTGRLQASTTALFTSGARFYDALVMDGADGLVLGNSASNLTATTGNMYFHTGDKNIRFYDGTAWYAIGTSSAGWTLNTPRVQFGTLDYYATLGTTTQRGLSIATIAASSTAAIPLTVVGMSGQTANTFQIATTSGGSVGNAFYMDNVGALFSSSTLQVTEAVTTYGNVTLGDAVADSVTANAYFTQLRIGTGATFGHIGAVGADELGVEGNVEIDGTTWVDGVLHASSTALFGGATTFYNNITINNSATTTVTFTDKGINFDSSVFVLDPFNNRVGIGTNTPSSLLDVHNTNGTSTITISTNSSNKGGCLKVRDYDGSGWSYLMTLNGSSSWSTVACD